MTEYKPGTVARVAVRHKDGSGSKASEYLAFWDGMNRRWISSDRGYITDAVDYWDFDIRPLVVLDLDHNPDPARELRLIANHYTVNADRSLLLNIADQIEEQTKPARIPEPGDWGVVEAVHADDHGFPRKWVRHASGRWFNAVRAKSVAWSELSNPVLIREGISD